MGKYARFTEAPSTRLISSLAVVVLLLTLLLALYLSVRKEQIRQYAAGATVTVTQVDTVVTGTGYSSYGTFGSHNQKVVANSHGIFISYLHSDYDANGTDDAIWRLARSTDGGVSFQTIYEEHSNGSKAPPLETDASGNIYVILSNLASGTWGSSHARFYRFDAAKNYQNPTITSPIQTSAGKFAMEFDPNRQCLYYITWDNHKLPDFYIVSLNGTLIKAIQLWKPGTIGAHYPQLFLAPNGILYVAWTTTDGTASGQDYYDAHFIVTPDGGTTWIGPSGNVTLPIPGASNTSSWGIVDSADIRPVGTTQANWLSNMASNGSSVHFVYDVNFGRKEVYKRFNWTNKTFDKQQTPYLHGETITIGAAHGFFSQDGSGTGRLFYAGDANGSLQGRVGILYSDDNGSTWHDYATSNTIVSSSGSIVYMSGSRRAMSDGSIIGEFTANNNIYFFRAKPVKVIT